MPNTNEILKVIADNPTLSAALRDLLEKQFAEEIAFDSLSDEHIGQLTRTRVNGLKKIAAAFKEIEVHKSVAERAQSPNPAR